MIKVGDTVRYVGPITLYRGRHDGKVVTVYREGDAATVEWPGLSTPVKHSTSALMVTHQVRDEPEVDDDAVSKPTYTGGSSDYYQVSITNTTTHGRPSYIAECNDIIEALGMNFAEGNAFKALWRRAAQRTLGLRKAGAKDDGLYDAEKVEFFGARLVAQSKAGGDDSE